MLLIHHARRARSARIIWLCEELGISYELRTFEFKYSYLKSPEYKQLHPLGQVPVVEVDGARMFESGAILQYLLEEHGKGRLEPAIGSPDRARYLQWFHFGEAGLARHMSDIARHRFGLPEPERNPAVAADARGRFHAAIAVVDQELGTKPYIVGADFTAADIMVAYGLVMGKITKELPEEFRNVAAYLERLKARPAYERAWA